MLNKLRTHVAFVAALILNSVMVFAASKSRSGGNVFSPVVGLLSDGSKSLLDLITNDYVFLVFIFLIITMLIYFIYHIGISLAGFAQKDNKFDYSKKIALMMAILSTVGLLGFASYGNNEFTIANIRANVDNVLSMFGAASIWMIAFLVSGLAYTMGMGTLKHIYHTEGTHPNTDPIFSLLGRKKHEKTILPGQRRWGVFLLSAGLFLWVGNTLVGTPESYEYASLGMVMSFIGLMMMVWPNLDKEKETA